MKPKKSVNDALKNVDVIIPFHPKDIDTLPWCIEGIRQHLPASRIVVIGKAASKADIERLHVEFMDEDTVVPGLRFSSFSGNRWGWYFQQILKLGIADWVEADYYLVVDADTVFLRKIPFFNDAGLPLYATGTEFHQPYFETFERLLGFPAHREFSFIVHHMLFNTRRVIEMRQRFACAHPWYLAIVRCMEQQLHFAEYETYGHYMKKMHPGEFELRQLSWSDIWILPTPSLLRRLSTYYDFCTFHSHYREKPISWWRQAMIRIKIRRRLIKFRLQSLVTR